jgi:hypothetical protein
MGIFIDRTKILGRFLPLLLLVTIRRRSMGRAVGGGIGRIMRLGFQPVNLTLQFYGNAVHPPGASPWGMRMQIAFLFPKKPKK